MTHEIQPIWALNGVTRLFLFTLSIFSFSVIFTIYYSVDLISLVCFGIVLSLRAKWKQSATSKYQCQLRTKKKEDRLSKRAISKTQVNYKLHYPALSFDPIASWKKSAVNTNLCHFSHTAPTQSRCLFHADNSMILVPNRM